MIDIKFVEYCVSEIKVAVKRFGVCQYNDKGPREVMSVDDVVLEMKKVEHANVVETLVAVCGIREIDVKAGDLVSEILHHLDGDKDYEFIFESDELMEYY